jgi:L-ascorbate oxidase
MHRAKTRARRGRMILAGALALGVSGAALAQSGSQQTGSGQEVGAPPLLTLTPPGPKPAQELGAAPTPVVEGPEVLAKLDVVYIKSRIWNPNSKMFDQVRLRAYQDATRPNDPNRPYVAPTLVAKPGNTVRILMRNLLPPEEGCPGHGGDINVPHCFNTTNLHSHGLWVSPAGISDNVLRTLPPNQTFTYEYEYNIPLDHPAGTFWYHPHVHGSTAIQVASGLAGALIVKGDRLPQRAAAGGVIPGDVDVLLKASPDKTFVFQQIQYICRDPNAAAPPGGLKPSKKNPDDTWRCDKDDVGVLDGYDVFGSNWKKSGRFTTVNGATTAVLSQDARVGVPERWRFIHGGVGDTIRVSIRKRTKGAKAIDLTRIGALKQDDIIDQQCEPTKEALPQFEIAADGLTRTRAVERASTFLQPGYRSDVLVAFDEPGEYCVIDETIDVAQAGVEGSSDRRQLLFLVNVDAAPGKAAPPRAQVVELLAKGAEALSIPDAAFKAAIVKGIRANLDLGAFAPHTTLANATIDTHQQLFFSLSNAATVPTKGPGVGNDFDKPARRFNPNDFSRTLVLGNTDEWELRIDPDDAVKIGHPFHIHVNPFEIMSVTSADGRDLTADPTSQYFGMKGAFKDTVFIEFGVVVKVRSHYRRYVGDFVLHCHILNHEDAGMMEMVRIADRGADGKPIPFGHGLTDAGEGVPHNGH